MIHDDFVEMYLWLQRCKLSFNSLSFDGSNVQCQQERRCLPGYSATVDIFIYFTFYLRLLLDTGY